MHTYLPDDLLVKTDIASMAHGVELRAPLLDPEFMNFFAKMPSDLKLSGKQKKYMFAKALVEEGILPAEVVYRRKQGFSSPLDSWFSGPLKPYLYENLVGGPLVEMGIMSEESLRFYTDGYYSSRYKYSKNLFTLLCLSKWLEKYF